MPEKRDNAKPYRPKLRYSATLAGFKKDDVSVTVEDRLLTISAAINTDEETADEDGAFVGGHAAGHADNDPAIVHTSPA